jgi:hypothetical protein
VDDFGMVEVKYESRYMRRNLLLAHQAQYVYYLIYPHPSLQNWWVVNKVNHEMHTRRYDEHIEGHVDGDIYQDEIEVDQNFMVSDGASLTELDTCVIELLNEEAGPSNKHLQKSKYLLERRERCE